MKQLLITIAAVVLVGCGESQQSSTPVEAELVEPVVKAPAIPIHQAVKEGNIEAVKQHLAAGTDVNARDDYGRTPLHDAAIRFWNSQKYVELLIDNGADVNTKSDNGATPLHIAAMRIGKTKPAELLIAEGADVNAKDDEGSTPLHYVAFVGHKEIPKEITELLIDNGADVNAKDVNGKTPLDAAIGAPRRRPKTIDLLRKHGGKTGEELKAEGK